MKPKLLALLFACFLLCLTSCASDAAQQDILIASRNSPDGCHTVQLYQVGSPGWSFGSVGAKLVLVNADGDVLEEESFSLNNDGGGVHAYNIESITWQDEQVEIVMNESDTIRQYTYTLAY